MATLAFPAEPRIGATARSTTASFTRDEFEWVDDETGRRYTWRGLLTYLIREPLFVEFDANVDTLTLPSEPPVGSVVRLVGSRRTWTHHNPTATANAPGWAEDPERLWWTWFSILDEGPVELIEPASPEPTATRHSTPLSR